MKRVLALLAMVSASASANMHLAPPDFEDMVFVDFRTAHYSLSYDFEARSSSVKTVITFESSKLGRPIFDLIEKPLSVKIDGVAVKQKEIELPDHSGKARVVDIQVQAGIHTLEIENNITNNVRFDDKEDTVSAAFWIRDLKERMFLEQYIPSNFEFDQYQMTLDLAFKNTKKISQDIFTNGELKQTGPLSYRITFPEYFTVSCPYFHTSRKGAFRKMSVDYPSITGRIIPITVYTPPIFKTSTFLKKAVTIMGELEKDYGPWGHPALVAYQTMPGTGGMEHAGATATSLAALDHEMLHSYFAKGVMPANGNSGWIDEAIASWRDKGYLRLPAVSFGGSNLGIQSVYKRHTDNRAYKLGAAFMAYVDYRLQNVGGLKAFLKGYFSTYNHTVINQVHFKNNLEFFSGLDLTHEFDTFIWGSNENEPADLSEDPVHKSLSQKQFLEML
jgi:hypothetical protein